MSCAYDIPAVSFSHFSITSNPSASLRHDGMSVSIPYGPGAHVVDMTRQLNEFRSHDHLCDIRLRVEDGTELPAHRVVLAAASPYFNTLFSSGFADSDKLVHDMPWLTIKTAQSIVGFMYTGKIILNHETVGNTLAAAEYLILPQLKQHCVFFMKSILSIKNVCYMKYLSELYQLKELTLPVDELLSSSCCGEVFEDKQLLALPLEFIQGLILDQRFKHIREIDIADFVVKWVEHDVEHRFSSLEKLFSYVLLDCLPAWYIEAILAKDLTRDVVKNRIKPKVDTGLYCEGIESDFEDIVLIVAAGANPPCVGYVPKQDHWVKFKPLPKGMDLRRRNMKTLCIGSKMYLLVTMEDSMAWLPHGANGGIHSVQFWCLDVEKNLWTQLATPNSTSKCFHLINVGPHICAIGIGGTLERYDTKDEMWLPCAPAPRTIAYFDTLQFTDNKSLFVLNIYSSSQANGGGHCLQMYDPREDSWSSSILTNKGNELVVLTYHLPGRRSSCEKNGDKLKLFNSLGIHWAEIDLEIKKVSCWRWKDLLPAKIYSSHGWTLLVADLQSLFILNSSTNHCAMFNYNTGYSKLTAACPTEIYLGQKVGCLAKISVTARKKLDIFVK